ncbi:MAG: MFS transporter [Anaerolineae bacterium]|nr:MFS transporter [Anaerolineae bacterium]
MVPSTYSKQLVARLNNTFIALRHRNYRLWFFGQLISLVGTWMQTTAQGYLVFELTHDPAYLGYVSFAAGIPTIIFTLYGGVISDRLSRRTLLLFTQTSMMILALILSALVFMNVVQPWMIIVLALLLGVANSFDGPARLSFVVELVDREDLPNAIALNASMFNLATVVGPAVSGITYAIFGAAWCFLINGLTFIAVIIGLVLMHIKPLPPRERSESALKEIAAGFQFVMHSDTQRVIFFYLCLIGMLGMGLVALLPAWATTVLGGDVTYNGYLLSARGVGSLVAALLLAYLVSKQVKGILWSIGGVVMSVCLLVFSFMSWLPASLLVITVFGFGFMLAVNASNALIQTYVSDDLRGRVMSIYSLILFGFSSLGSLILGLVASWIGEPVAVGIGGVILIVVTVIIQLIKPQMRQLK